MSAISEAPLHSDGPGPEAVPMAPKQNSKEHDDARRAVGRFKDPEQDPNNPKVIQTYLDLRDIYSRISPDLLKRVHAKKQEVQQASTMKTTFWVVPKQNFCQQELPGPSRRSPRISAKQPQADSDGLLIPDEVKEFMLEPSQVQELEMPGSTLDLTQYIIVDQGCPRSRLGKGAEEIQFSLSALTRYLKVEENDHIVGKEATGASTTSG